MEQKRSSIAAAGPHQEAPQASPGQAQLARTEVRADVPGIVVYRDVFFGSEQRKPQVGDQVWANQPLLILPDISKMVVETRVRETDIHKVEKNQNVTVRVQAYPDLKLSGKVTLVGTLAQEEKERRGVKFFGVTIQINESEPRLRPGMTAAIEIQVERRAQTLRVPLEAVFERDGQHLCYVATRPGLVAREVVVGLEPRLRGHRARTAEGDRVAARSAAAPSGLRLSPAL
jgi:HlyD family secretion protein